MVFHGVSRESVEQLFYIMSYSVQHSQYDIRAAHDGKVGCNTVECTVAFLYSDWLYFLWHGINRGYYTVARRYEFYVRVARTISHEFAALTREI